MKEQLADPLELQEHEEVDALGGWVGNLVVYLITKYNVKSIDATQVNNVVLGCLSLFPIAGAIISDSFYGSFPVIVFFSIVSLMGVSLMMLTSSLHSLTPPPCKNFYRHIKPKGSPFTSIARVIVAAVNKRRVSSRNLGVRNVLNVVAMVSSAFLEVKRLHVARLHHLMGSRTGATTVVQFSALWLVGPLTVLGISKALHFPAQVSLYYQEFPTSLCNTSTAMISLLIASGFYVSTAITSLIRNNTMWLMDDINNGRLDIVYSVLAAIGVVDIFLFVLRHFNTN
ncbi:NRT1/ PTR family 2.7-like protein [Tanacetum coccineum]